MNRSTLLFQGLRNTLPLILGVAPFGMIYGVLAVQAGLAASTAQAMSAVVFAGSSQFIIVQQIGGGAPWPVIVLTAFIVNLRHALYSASLAPYLKHLSPLWKSALAYFLVDEAYAVGITRFAPTQAPAESHPEPFRHWYLLGAGLAVWISWQISTAAGIFLGAQVPSSWSLDFTLALTFIALVVPVLKDRPMVLAAASAALTAAAAYHLPYKSGLILAALVGIAVGLWSERRGPA